jgi:hypothetical protein
MALQAELAQKIQQQRVGQNLEVILEEEVSETIG